MSLLELTNISMVRGDRELLHDISFRVEPGQHWVIFGGNGSGKSLLLQVIEGYEAPSSGTVRRFGLEPGTYDLRELRRRTGYLTTAVKRAVPRREPVLDVVMSGRFASIGIYDDCTPDDRHRAGGLLELAGCSGLADRAFGTLSDGEQARVLIARALMPDPALLILDEPGSNLDIRAREELLASLASAAREHAGLSIILVTHHVEEIIHLFTHLLVLKEGRVFARGPVEGTLTADTIGEALGVPVRLFEEQGRRWCVVKPA